MRLQFVYLGLCTLVVAALIHIAIVLLVPYFGEKDAARYVMERSSTSQFRTKDSTGAPILPNADPFFASASCRFNLNESGVLATGNNTDLFWSAAVFNERGRVIYSLNRRSAIGSQLRMIVVNPVQMARMRQFQTEELETSIVVETTEATGFILIRALQRDASTIENVDSFLGSLNCSNYQQQS